MITRPRPPQASPAAPALRRPRPPGRRRPGRSRHHRPRRRRERDPRSRGHEGLGRLLQREDPLTSLTKVTNGWLRTDAAKGYSSFRPPSTRSSRSRSASPRATARTPPRRPSSPRGTPAHEAAAQRHGVGRQVLDPQAGHLPRRDPRHVRPRLGSGRRLRRERPEGGNGREEVGGRQRPEVRLVPGRQLVRRALALRVHPLPARSRHAVIGI